jgi:chromosome segregation ATPase
MSEIQNNADSVNLKTHCEAIVENMNNADCSKLSEETNPVNSGDLETSAPINERQSDLQEPVTKNIDWQQLAHKLREHNRKLLKKVFQLEQTLAETDSQLKQHLDRSQHREILVEQQAKAIKEFQEQIANLSEDIEESERETKTQQILIETLSKQLEVAQQQTAQLERECALLQESHNQKTYELIAQGQQTQELHSRLSRQQRYTLQYKAALDRYLNNITDAEALPTLESSEIPPEIKNQPIQAWSSVAVSSNSELVTDKKINLPKTNPALISDRHRLQEKSKSQSDSAANTEWPAPDIAKIRQEQKRQSLAAVDLPRFPRPQ